MRRAVKLWLAAAAVLCSISPKSAHASTITLKPTMDSYVEYGTPNTNYGTAPTIIVKNSGAIENTTRYGFLHFNLSGVSGAQITGAKLRLYGFSGNSTPDKVGVYAAGHSWTETGITWNNKPSIDVSAAHTPTFTVESTPEYYSANVAGLMPKGAVADNSVLSFALEMTNVASDNQADSFYSRNEGKNAPQLVLTYNAPPTVATPAAANPTPVTGTSTSLSVLGADDGGESNLTYTWSSTGPSAVTFSPNGANAAKNATATFGGPGNYTLTATIKDAGGLIVTSSVDVTVNVSTSVLSGPTGLGCFPYSRENYLNWTAVNGATSYNIYRGTSAGGEGATPVATGVTTASYLDTGLTNGTTYYYQVTAVSGSESGKSNETSGTPVLPVAPNPVSATASSISAITVTWSPEHVTGWELFRGTSPGGEGSTPYKTIQEPLGPAYYPGSTSSYIDTALPAGTYYYYVIAVSGSDVSSPSNEVSVTVPPHPTGLTATAGDTTVSLSWTGNPLVIAYDIYRGTTPGGESSTAIASTTSTSYTDTGLADGTTYYYFVKSDYQVVTSAPSNEASATPVPPIPSAPTGLSATPGDTTASLSWTASSGATSYNIYRGTTSGGESATAVGTASGTTFTDTGLTDATTYYYIVKAVNAGGTSAASNEASVLLPVGAPTNLTATPGDTTASLSWTAGSGAASYNVYAGTTSGGESLVASNVTSTSYTVTGLTDGATYYFEVRALGGGGISAFSNEASALLPPAAPANLTATVGDTTVPLTWTASTGATSYNIYRGTTSGGESSTAVGSATGASYIDTGLSNGATYYYIVKAVNASGTSAASNEANATPEPPAPAAPTDLSASGTATQIGLTWATTTSATSYNVYRGTSTGGEGATPYATGVTTTSFVDTSVVNGVTYYYTVAAVDAGGTSGMSNEAGASTTTFSLDINSGGSAASPYVADTDFSGGSTSSTSSAIDTSLLTGSIPPQAVLQSNRYGTYTYTIPGVTAGGLYNVTLYFAEEYSPNYAVGKRVFNVTINGAKVLSSFDIYAAAGAGLKAVQRSFPVTANGSGQIVISTTNITDNAQINGIAIVSGSGGMAPIAPSGLTASSSGMKILLSWTAGSGATSYNIYRGTSTGGEGATPYATTSSASFVDTNVTAGTTYYYTVAGVNPSGTSSKSNEASASPVQPGPFGGTPVQLPGTVQAENYDVGGFDSGYYVTSVNGSANSYRSDGVDLEVTSDTTGAYDLGWSSTGQWFNYTVEVVSPGPYTVTFRTASDSSGGGTLHIQDASGNNLTGAVSIPDTNGWQTWTNVTANLTLPAGIQTLKLYQDTGGYNLNYMSFAWAGTPGPTNLAASGENRKVFLNWSVVSGVTSYNVYRGTSPAGESATPIATGVTGTTFTDTGLANGTTYYYTVAGVTSGGATTGMSNESSATPTTEGPYGGTAWPIPGTVQAENYDVGGEGAGYHDTDAANNGGQYRSDGVDIEQCTDLTGGYDVGWTAAGEWLNYTVNVASTGSYVVQTRVASNGAGGTFHYNVDGSSATSEITVPDTGGWQVWDTLSTTINLTAGQHVIQLYEDSIGSSGGVANFNWFAVEPPSTGPNFGSNVFIFNPSMPASTIQSTINTIFSTQQFSQFGSDRAALLFAPGTYNLDVNVGYYTQILGLGQLPDDTLINGYVQQMPALPSNNATCNFWTGMENLAVNPVDSGGTDTWAVSQADPIRRVHMEGNLDLAYNGGYTSGGFMSDSLIDGAVNSESQQQWLSRNDQWSSWNGSVWNMVFVGDVNAPANSFPADTTVSQTPTVREKPYLTVDSSGNYYVFVPSIRTLSQGTTWGGGSSPGQYLPISQFYIAQPGVDTAATINTALASGKNLILTPGEYFLTGSINVTNPNTIVLGLGLPTLIARNGITPMTVADVDGCVIAGIIFDAGSTNSPVLLQVGPSGSTADHSANPTSLHDIFFRIGGAEVGEATTTMQINSNNVIGDDFWIWRADHGNSGTVGWTTNTAANGLTVNGNNVTIYGLAVEHYQQYQTVWNGNGGSTYFYQSELPYDVPSDASWTPDGTTNGYASYYVNPSVTTHNAYGLGIYSVFNNTSVVLDNAILAPITSGVQFDDMVTIDLDGGINHIIDNEGAAVNSSNFESTLTTGP